MNQAQFERLSWTLVSAIPRVRNEETLLQVACTLLDSEVGVLISRTSGREGVTIRHIHPEDFPQLDKEKLDALREWYNSMPPEYGIHGFTKEDEIRVADRKFSDALVAFGSRSTDDGVPMHEVVLLRKKDATERFLSYDCWVTAQLIRQFELFDTRQDLAEETRKKRQYAAAIWEVLSDEEWDELKKRVQGLDDDARWLAYAIWVGYQMRKRQGGYPAIEQAVTDLRKQERPRPIFDFIINFRQRRAMDPMPLWEEIEKNVGSVRNRPWPDENSRLWSQIAALVLEHSWRALARGTEDRAASIPQMTGRASVPPSVSSQGMNLETAVEHARKLLRLTRAVMIGKLSSKEAGSRESGDSRTEMLELGRGFLRFYLAMEIAKPGSRLEQLYLGGERRDEYREAAPELKRTFITNLSRFMLGVVARLEEDFNIRATAARTTPPVITAVRRSTVCCTLWTASSTWSCR